jgi:hypothetical protein
VKAALADSNWKQAMTDEYNDLIRNNTWSLVQPTDGINIVGHKWVFRVKYNADGSVKVWLRRDSIRPLAWIFLTPSVR